MPQTTLKLTMASTNAGQEVDDVYLEVGVLDANGNAVIVRFDWGLKQESITTIGDAQVLQGVFSGSHLAAMVGSFLWDRFQHEHTYLADVFMNATGDEWLELDMPVALANYEGQ